MKPVPASHRRRASVTLVSLGVVLAIAGGLLAYSGSTLSSSRGFAERATGTLKAKSVRDTIARRVTAELVSARPNLIAVRPLVEGVTERIVATDAFAALFRGGVYDLHRSVFDSHANTRALRVADVGVLVTSALGKLAPKAAKRVPPGAGATLATVSGGDFGRLSDVAAAADDVQSLGVWLLAGALLALGLSVAVAADRLSALARAGRWVGLAALCVVILYTLTRPLVLGRFASGGARDAAGVVWNAFLADLRLYALLAAVGGAALAAGAAVLQDRPARPLRARAEALLTGPAAGSTGLVRGAGLVALGLALILAWATIARLVALVVGAALVYTGLRELLRVALATSLPRVRAGRRVRAGVLVALLLGLILATGVFARSHPPPAFAGGPCNGYRALCHRPLDRVAFAATHNSMGASTLPGWLFPSQDGDIPAQLDAGVRGLLIDTHYGFSTPRGVATELTKDTKSRALLVDAVGKQFVSTAARLRSRIGYRGGGSRAVYLCHAFCEVGSTPARRALDEIRDFVVAHPGEVLVLSIQDDISPADTEAAFRASGLLDLVYMGQSGPHWPTLAQLIAQNRRIVVFGENDTGGIGWYRPQFKQFEETPYHFPTAAKLEAPSSCRPNRGGTRGSLFLLNHWVETTPAPRPTNADRVNAYPFLMGRARRCGKIRGRLPNLIAVDFYGRGDVLRVTRELNGVR